jgi:6-phosphogluconolactonase (cycloisomerase 2 family)
MAIRAKDSDRRRRSDDRPPIARSLPAGLALIILLGADVAPAGADSLGYVEALFDGVGGVDGLDNAHAAAVSPDGAHVYVASDADDAVAVFARDPLTGELTFVEAEFDGIGGVDGLDGTEALALSPDGAHLYAAGLLDNAVAVFSRDAGTGELTFVEAEFDGAGGVNGLAGANSVAVSPDGGHVYVAGRFDDAVAVFQRNAANGTLTFLDVEIDGAGGVDGLTDVTSVAVSPDGEHVYAASNGDQAVAIFDRGPATGLLTFVTSVSDTLPDAQIDVDDHRTLTLSPDGAHLYVANHVEDLADGWIATFERNPASGLLTPVPPVLLGDEVDACPLGIEGDSRVAVAADGTRAYANLTFDTSVTAFERNPATGRLTVLASVCDETIGMGGDPAAPDGLWGVQWVALDPEGRHLYAAAGNLEDAVAVLQPVVFADGFESGDTSAWTSTVP